MRLGTAIEQLVEAYKYASDKEWIQDKVAWALYHTWKEADRKDEPQTNADQHAQRIESVETMSCQECKHWIYDDRWDWFCPLKSQDECKYEPKDEPQTERSE